MSVLCVSDPSCPHQLCLVLCSPPHPPHDPPAPSLGHVCSAVSSRRLVPGDVLVVLPGKACCDMVLLQGNCLVEESNLSGEVMINTFTALFSQAFLQHLHALSVLMAVCPCIVMKPAL